MYGADTILCACNAYDKKYYLNPDFDGLPDMVKDELKIMCVLYAEEAGGILTLVFDDDGNLLFQVVHDDGDILFDEISSGLKIKQMQKEKKELLVSIELYYRAFFLDEDISGYVSGAEELWED